MDKLMYELAEKQAALCKLLGSPRRLLILWQISEEELPVHEIAVRVGSTIQNVSQHLSLLKKSGVVIARREGQVIYYQIADHEYLRNCPAIVNGPESKKSINN
jgi:DNA-binding transcriptional ArsR family regulator